MLQNFKVTSYAIILVLFGLTLMTVSPVIAADGDGFTVCDNMPEAASKLSCFRDLARSLRAAVENMTTAASSQEAAVDDAEGTKEALKLQIEEISGWLKDKDAKIAELQEQLSTASSESQAKDETIADLTDRLASFEQSQAEFDATIAELQEQLSTASSESQAKDGAIAALQRQLLDVKINSNKGMSLEGLQDLISERLAAEIKMKTKEYCTDRTREEGTCIGGRAPRGYCVFRPFAKGCKDMKAMDPEWRLDQAFEGCDKEQSGEGAFTGCD